VLLENCYLFGAIIRNRARHKGGSYTIRKSETPKLYLGMPTPRTLLKLCRVRDLMRDCLDQPLTLEDLSLEVDLSAWHFLREFRTAFGETPHDFLTRLRVERAKELLTISSRPVTEICFDVGFSSLGSFSTLFRREVGMSPAQFRRQVRTWVSVPGRFPWMFIPFCFSKQFGFNPDRR
jgi:transcriptional regulator GlxA family with amidase domain